MLKILSKLKLKELQDMENEANDKIAYDNCQNSVAIETYRKHLKDVYEVISYDRDG